MICAEQIVIFDEILLPGKCASRESDGLVFISLIKMIVGLVENIALCKAICRRQENWWDGYKVMTSTVTIKGIHGKIM